MGIAKGIIERGSSIIERGAAKIGGTSIGRGISAPFRRVSSVADDVAEAAATEATAGASIVDSAASSVAPEVSDVLGAAPASSIVEPTTWIGRNKGTLAAAAVGIATAGTVLNLSHSGGMSTNELYAMDDQ